MLSNRFYKKLARFLPLGVETETTFRQICTAYAIAICFSLGVPCRILGQYNNLFYKEGTKKILYEGIMMPMFGELAPTWFVLFGAFLIGCAGMVAMFYLHHRQESMSIYTMRRLPNRWELHIRCLTVPIAAALLAIILAILLMLLYYAFYMWLVPDQCIAPGQLTFLISELTGGLF